MFLRSLRYNPVFPNLFFVRDTIFLLKKVICGTPNWLIGKKDKKQAAPRTPTHNTLVFRVTPVVNYCG